MAKSRIIRLRLATAPIAVAAMALAPSAFAQEADDGTDAGTTELVVTGSRIARTDEAASPVPLAVVGSADIALDGAPNISDILNEMPQTAIGITRTNTNFLTSGTGIATVNLRDLGSSRTLVLVNGRRFISGFAGDSAVDLNNIPTDFIDRVEIVTGGSSAVYGSDAIAGVVNFILKDKFNGVSVRGQYGITEHGDNGRYLASITAGTSFGAEDRGNILLNFSYDKDMGLRSRDRAISAQDCSGTVCGLGAFSSYAPQGQFRTVNASGQAVNILPGGRNTFSFNPDNSVAYLAGFDTGQYGFNRNSERYISVPLERYLASGVGNFDLTDNVTAFAEVTYAKVKSRSRLEPFALDILSDVYYRDIDPYGIPITNPFIPAAVAAAIAAANSDADPTNDVDAINGRRRQNDVFDRSNVVSRDTWRVVAGLKGELGRFKWDASYVYGHLRDYNASEDIDNNRYRNALNAIRVGPGNVVGVDIVCADAAARAEGCIPLDIFGYNTADPRAANYVKSVVPKSELITNKQQVWSANISGPVFALPAGDVGLALGVEYRKESSVSDLDILTNTGGNSGNVTPDTRGDFDVLEFYGEVNVPLLSGKPFFEYLGLIGAARLSDYSTVGSTFSWNAGAEWSPLPGLRFRGVYAEANRAPNISELFTAPSETFASVSDPCDGITASTGGDYGAACRAIPAVQAAITANGIFKYSLADLQGINGFIGGNTALREETAKTYTLGMVYQPSFVRNLLLTVDYYNIKVEGAISTLGRSYSISQCVLTGLPIYCDNVTRDATTGFVTRVDGQLLNVAGLWSEGVDVGVRYNMPLGLSADDSLGFSLNYTYLIASKQQGDPADDVINYAGTFGNPRHNLTSRLTYRTGGFSISWQANYHGGGDYIKDYFNANPAVQALNKIDGFMLHNAQLRWQPGEDKKFDFYVGVDNIFDKKPQYIPGSPFGTPTGLETSPVFDLYGRRFYAGAVVKF